MKDKILSLGYPYAEVNELIKVSKNINKDYKKLLKNYPIQYLIGYSSFYGYKFKLNKNTLIPRLETEYLVEKTIKYIKRYFNDSVKICDLGTGCGCIAIALDKELENAIVDGYDFSLFALKTAKINKKLNQSNVNFYWKNILKPINKKYDVLISNPPYITNKNIVSVSVNKYEPHKALYARDNGLEFYKAIIKNSKSFMNSKSILAFEIGYEQGKELKKIAYYYYPTSQIVVEKDLSKKDRFLFIFNV